jgi:hypothetical protein
LIIYPERSQNKEIKKEATAGGPPKKGLWIKIELMSQMTLKAGLETCGIPMLG